MLKIEPYKDIILYILAFLVLLLTFLLFNNKKENTELVTKSENPDNIATIIVDNEPFYFPDDFKKYLKSKNIITMTFGNEKGEIRLVLANGKMINPCENNTDNSSDCQYESGLNGTHKVLASLSGITSLSNCGFCKANGINRDCDKLSNKYTCATQASFCGTTCR